MGKAAFSLPYLDIDGNLFRSPVTPPASNKSLFLAGAEIRGLEIEGRFVKFTTIGVYLEESAIESLAATRTGKTADELSVAPDFYEDIINGPFDKFVRVTMVVPLTGEQYSVAKPEFES